MSLPRQIADKITDEMLRTPVGELEDWEVALLQAALRGPHGQEIMERIDAFKVRGSQGEPA